MNRSMMVEQMVFSLVQHLLTETTIQGLETPALQAVSSVLESDMSMLHLRGATSFDLAAQTGFEEFPEVHRHRMAEWAEQEAFLEGRVLTWNVPEDYHGPSELNYANLGVRQAIAFGLRGGSGLVGHATFLFRERAARDAEFELLNNVGAVWGLQLERVRSKASLEATEGIYRLITENAQDLILLVAPDESYSYVSPSVKSILGYEVDEFKTFRMRDWVDPDGVKFVRENREAIVRSGRDVGKERHRARCKDGHYTWLETTWRIIRDPNTNEIAEVQTSSRDVNEQVLAQEKLETSERLYRLLTEQSSNLIQLLSADRNLLYVSPSVKTILQYEPQEYFATPPGERIHPEDREVARRMYDLALASNQDAYTIQNRVRRKDGEYIWMESTLKFIRDAATGELTEVQTSSRDITSRILAQQKLEASERLYRLLSEQSNDLIQLFSVDREVLYVSPSVKNILQYDPEEYAATPPRERIHPEDRELTENMYTMALASNQGAYTFETRVKRKDGEYIWMETSLRFIRDAATGNITEIQTTGRDVSERVRARDELSTSERGFRRLFTDNPLPMWVYDRETLAFLEVNEAAVQKYGYSRDEFLAMRITDIRPEEDVPALTRFVANRTDGVQLPSTWRHVLKDGRIIHAEVSGYGMQYGIRPAVLVVIKDVTDQLRAEREMERLNEQLERRVQRLTALREIDRAIASSVDLHLTLSVFLTQLMSELGVSATAISLLNPHTLTLEVVTRVGFIRSQNDLTTIRLGEGLAGRAALERRTIEVHDLTASTALAGNREALTSTEGFKSYFAVPLIAKGQVKGVLGVFFREPANVDEEWHEFLAILAGQAAIAIDNLTLFEDLQRSNMDLRLAYDQTIEGWSRALDLRDKETEGHSQRVTQITLRLAERLGMAPDELVHVRRGALLHDIGKMGVPDSILLKPGKLTPDERLVIEKHPDLAHELLSPIQFLRAALDIPYAHHEKWDGLGYPRGLTGEQIPLAARIFAVVDVWDALLSERPYRPGWPEEKVLEHIRQDAGKHFDPRVVDTFLEMMKERVPR